jgi:hypothetical protein
MCRTFRLVTPKAAHFGVGVTAGCSSIRPPGCVTATWLVVAFVNDALLAFDRQAPSVDQLPRMTEGRGATTQRPPALLVRRLNSGTDLAPVGRRMRGRPAVATSWQRLGNPGRPGMSCPEPGRRRSPGSRIPSPPTSPRLRCSLRSELGNKSLTAPAPETRPVRTYPSSLQCQGCAAFLGALVYEVVNAPWPVSAPPPPTPC